MEKGSFESALRDLVQREHKVTIVTVSGTFVTSGRIHEVFDDYLVLRTGRKMDRDVLYPLGSIASIHVQ